MDSVYRREMHAFSTNLAVDWDDNEALPEDDVEVPVSMQVAEDEDVFVQHKGDEWTDYGLGTFLSSLPLPASAHQARNRPPGPESK